MKTCRQPIRQINTKSVLVLAWLKDSASFKTYKLKLLPDDLLFENNFITRRLELVFFFLLVEKTFFNPFYKNLNLIWSALFIKIKNYSALEIFAGYNMMMIKLDCAFCS